MYGSTDQFAADYDTYYPEFSDINVKDVIPPPARARGYEQAFQLEQQGRPTYRCGCDQCLNLGPRPHRPMNKLSLDQRGETDYTRNRWADIPIIEKFGSGESIESLLIMFIFIIIIIFCLTCKMMFERLFIKKDDNLSTKGTG